MKGSRGFTLTELIVVVSIIGIMLLLTLTYGMAWYRAYRLQEATQTFANAATAVRVRAIGGMPSYNVKQIARQSATLYRIYLSDFTYICPPDPSNSSHPAEFPVKSTSESPYHATGDYDDDFVILTGFDVPNNINDNLFRVTAVNYGSGSPTLVSGTTNQWKITGAYADLECNYCDPTNPSDCSKYLTWDITTMGSSPQPPAGVGCPPADANGWCAGYELGRLRVIPCLKFVPYSSKQNLNTASRANADYSVRREYAGNSVQCIYNCQVYNVTVSALQRKASSTSTDSPEFTPPGGSTYSCSSPPPTSIAIPPSIAFDFVGGTREHLKYFVAIRRVKSDGYTVMPDNQSPPANFVVDPTGRVRMGRFDVSREQFFYPTGGQHN